MVVPFGHRGYARFVLPTVVIEAPPAERGTALAAVMVDACSQAVFEGQCALASEGGDEADTQAQAVAIVTWTGADHRVARVEVGLRRAARGEWLSRTIEFTKDDAPAERWKAVGLVIATLAGQTLHVEAPAPTAPPPAPSAPPPAPRPEAPPTRTGSSGHDTAWLDVEALLAPGLDTGAARRGGSLRVAWAPSSVPLFATVGAAYAWTPRDASTGLASSWTTLALGVGAVTPAAGGALRFDARLEALAQRFDASAVAASGATDDGSRWVGGARLGVDGAWMPARFVGVVASAEGSLLGGGTDVTVGGVRAGRDAPNALGFAGLLGLRGALP